MEYGGACKIVYSFVQIETIFELGDVDGDGEIELGEFIGSVSLSHAL